MATQILLRRGTAAAWTGANPTLASGEAGVETDSRRMKLGDGATPWNSLAYQDVNLEPHAETHAAGESDALTPADLGAYRAQTPSASADMGGAVTLPFADNLTLRRRLTSNWTSSAEPTGLADGENAEAMVDLNGFSIYAKPVATATAVYLGSWTVTGPTVRVGVHRVGSVYYWTAISG